MPLMAKAAKEAGADIIALDCTLRERGDGKTPGEFIKEITKVNK